MADLFHRILLPLLSTHQMETVLRRGLNILDQFFEIMLMAFLTVACQPSIEPLPAANSCIIESIETQVNGKVYLDRFEYDGDNKLIKQTRKFNGVSQTFEYDWADGSVTRMRLDGVNIYNWTLTDDRFKIGWEYSAGLNESKKPTSASRNGGGINLSFEYDKFGNVKSYSETRSGPPNKFTKIEYDRKYNPYLKLAQALNAPFYPDFISQPDFTFMTFNNVLTCSNDTETISIVYAYDAQLNVTEAVLTRGASKKVVKISYTKCE